MPKTIPLRNKKENKNGKNRQMTEGVNMSEKAKRIIMTVAGVSLSGFSVGMFNYSSFGMDPFQVFAHGVWNLTNIGFGTFYTILNCLMLIVVFLADRKKIGLGTFINIFVLGYMVEFSSWLFEFLLPDKNIYYRVILLIAGIIVLCFASALYFTADMGVSTYDAVAIYMAEHKVAKFQYCRIATDVICVGIGFFLGAIVGVGTLFAAFFMGPIIAFFKRTIAEPLRYGRRNVVK